MRMGLYLAQRSKEELWAAHPHWQIYVGSSSLCEYPQPLSLVLDVVGEQLLGLGKYLLLVCNVPVYTAGRAGLP